jgi:hypothetical protein
MTTPTAEYKLLDTSDILLRVDGEPLYPTATGDRTEYPGNRRTVAPGGPPPGSVLVKTGGNALRAIDRELVEGKNLIQVVVPPGTNPGDVILVQCPYDDRLVSAVIPEGARTGHAFLVEVPPLEQLMEEQQPLPTSGTGNVRDSFTKPLVGTADFTTGYDVMHVVAEQELEKRHFGTDQTGIPK